MSASSRDGVTNYFNDLHALNSLATVLAGLEPMAEPKASVIHKPIGGRPDRLGILAGSFNPLTGAHCRLAKIAKQAAALDAVCFSLAKATVDKEAVVGALLEDRLLVLRRYAERRAGMGVLAVNRGLYVDQAVAIHAAFPDLKELFFIVGFDKILQIFDRSYYPRGEATLQALFECARFLVAPRPGFALQEDEPASRQLELLLDQPENRTYRDRIAPLPFRSSPVSSTLIRQSIVRCGVAAGIPREANDFISATNAYQPSVRLAGGEEIDRYGVRTALIRALFRKGSVADENDLGRLLDIAWSDGEGGRELRSLVGLRPTR